ncbi:MAG: hypothetical protein HYX30_11035 [Mycobacterium nebraskense]|nr:hypothetical protein [Mycobacterium nebraskense]
MDNEFNFRIVNRPLENLAVLFKERGPDRLSLPQRSADRPLEGLSLQPTLDFREEAKLPLRSEATRLLREPYVQLPGRQGKRPAIKFHPTPLGVRPH